MSTLIRAQREGVEVELVVVNDQRLGEALERLQQQGFKVETTELQEGEGYAEQEHD